MGTSVETMEFLLDQLYGHPGINHRKMFGEYMVYVNEKPLLLVCDNTVFVKIVPELAAVMEGAQKGLPYEGGKEHYILDIDDTDKALEVISILEPITPLPKRRKKKRAEG